MLLTDSARIRALVAPVLAGLLVLAACGSDAPVADQSTALPESTATSVPAPTAEPPATATEVPAAAESEPVAAGAAQTTDCDAVAALFVTRGSANPDLDDPFVSASCDGETITISSNGIPDYTYIGTSPGFPTDRGHEFTIPATPTFADEFTEVPVIGISAVTLGGIPIFGPTEGTGGDVDSLPGILSVCGSHNGPSGFHIHKISTSTETDCLFTPAEVAAEPQLVGYALDGFPIYTGTGQYESSWALTDESLFATDTWAAHSYIEGSGDLDQCNGLTDADGNYAYYTTSTFPYVMGCYVGEVEARAGAGGDDGRPARAEPGEGGPTEGGPTEGGPTEGGPAEGAPAEGAERPERPERPGAGEGEDGERPERPEPPAAGEDTEQP